MLHKIKKIIFGVFLCFIFLNIFPTHVLAVGGKAIGDYSGWDKTSSSISSTVRLVESGTGMDDVGLDWNFNLSPSDKIGGTFDIEPYQLKALSQARSSLGFSSPLTGESLGLKNDGKFFVIKDNQGNASYYYMEGNKPDDKKVFLGHATVDGKLYIPKEGSLPKASGSNQSTDITTERGFMNAVDVENGRAPGTTYSGLTNVDQIDSNKDDLATKQKNLDELKQKQANDDAAIEYNRTHPDDTQKPVLSSGERAILDQQIREAEATVSQIRENVNQGRELSEKTEITTDACKEFFGFGVLQPTCWVSIGAILATMIMKLSALALYIVGQVFDYSIEISVNSAQFIKSLVVVEPMWAAIRDLLNMTFIFFLVFISWQILLGKGNYNVKNSVARLVLVAVLINFSLFAAKIMVDGSNIISLNIYEAMKVQGSSPDESRSISARVMSTLGLPTVYNISSAVDGNTITGCGSIPSMALTIGIFGTILIVITTMTFLLASLLFFLRMLNILVLFVTSPIWVWGYVIDHPFVKQQTEKWQSNMFHVLKFPIMYMLMIYGSLAIFAKLNSSQTGTSFLTLVCRSVQDGGSGLSGNFTIIINFIITISCLIGAMVYAGKQSSSSSLTGKLSSRISDRFTSASRKITTGAAQGLYNKSTGLALKGTKAVAGAPVRALRFGARQAGYAVADKASNLLGGWAAKPSVLGPRAQTAYAMLSQRIKDPSIFGEKKKEGIERRTKGVTARAETLSKVVAEQMKIESEEDFLKKNPGGDYKKYADEKIQLIEEAYIGKLKDSVGEDGATLNSDAIRKDVIESYVDKDGKVRTKVNQSNLFSNMQKVRDFHEKDGSLLKAEKESRLGWITEERAKARLKAKSKAFTEARNKARGFTVTVESLEKEIKADRDKIEKRFPSIDSIDPEKVSDSDLKNYDSSIRAYIQGAKNAIKERDRKVAASTSAADTARYNDEAKAEIEDLKLTATEKREKEKNSAEDKLEKKIKKLDDLKNKDKK